MKTYNVRGKRVVLDREVAAYVGIDTKYLKKVVRRNHIFFEGDNFVFELTQDELLQCQNEFCGDKFVSSKTSGRGGSRYLPFAFTAKGVSMLEKVLKRSIPIEFEDEPPLPAIYGESWNEGTVVLYSAENLSESLEVKVTEDDVWLNRNQMAILFGRDIKTISKHINNALLEELQNTPTVANFATVQTEGGREVLRYIVLCKVSSLMLTSCFQI